MKAFWLLLFLGCLQEKEVQVEESALIFTKVDSSEMSGSIELVAQDVWNADTIMSWQFLGNGELQTLFEFTLHPNDSISFELSPKVKMDEAAQQFFDYIWRGLKKFNE